LIAELNLDLGETSSEGPASDSIDHISSPDLSTPTAYYGQAGTALICFHDSPESSAHSESPHHVFHPPAPEASTFLLFQEDDTAAHSLSQVATAPRCLVDSGSTLNTVGDASALHDYDTPPSSPIKMCSATGQIVRPVGQGNLLFSFNNSKDTLALPCQHTPAIATSIMSPAETCERLGYDIYILTCNRQTSMLSLRFTKTGAPDIEILGTFSARLPHIPLMTQLVNSLCSLAPCRPIPIGSQDLAHERLPDHAHTAMHQVLRLCQRFDPAVDALSCSTGVLHLVHETVVDDITHAGCHPSKMCHVSDAVNCTLWHLRTCHPNPVRLVQLSKVTQGIPRITYHQQIEKCSDCLVTKMRKVARGSDPDFEATHLGQGLALDVGFMFQRSKNKSRADLLTGINGCNAYCIVYDFLTEVILGSH
jgi:hypothetical protein